MKCTECPDYKKCNRENDLRRKRHKCKKAHEPKTQTNADRIRAMSDEELAAFIEGESWMCCTYDYCDECPMRKTGGICFSVIEWLKQHARDGEDNG